MRTRYLVAGGAGLFAAGLGTGLLAKPARVETRVQEVTKDRVVYQDRIVERQVATAQTKEVTRWRTRLVTKPDGTKVETREVDTGKDAATTSDVGRTEDHAGERVTERVVYKDRVVEGARARWLVGAGAGADLSLRLHYGALAGYRLLGPLVLAVAVDVPARAATLYVAVQF